MNLEDLKSSWKQHKIAQGLRPIQASELLLLTQEASPKSTKSQRILVNVVLFLIITLFIQGG